MLGLVFASCLSVSTISENHVTMRYIFSPCEVQFLSVPYHLDTVIFRTCSSDDAPSPVLICTAYPMYLIVSIAVQHDPPWQPLHVWQE
jgi:hypothetical protein